MTALSPVTLLSRMTPVMARGNRGAVRGVIPVYRNLRLVDETSSGRGQADLGEKALYRTMAGSSWLPEQIQAPMDSGK